MDLSAILFFNLGVIHTQMQNYEGAEKAFEEAHFLNEEDLKQPWVLPLPMRDWEINT